MAAGTILVIAGIAYFDCSLPYLFALIAIGVFNQPLFSNIGKDVCVDWLWGDIAMGQRHPSGNKAAQQCAVKSKTHLLLLYDAFLGHTAAGLSVKFDLGCTSLQVCD
jgi:hypothetical protein